MRQNKMKLRGHEAKEVARKLKAQRKAQRKRDKRKVKVEEQNNQERTEQ